MITYQFSTTKISNPVSTAINIIKSKTTSIPNALFNFYSIYRNYLLGGCDVVEVHFPPTMLLASANVKVPFKLYTISASITT